MKKIKWVALFAALLCCFCFALSGCVDDSDESGNGDGNADANIEIGAGGDGADKSGNVGGTGGGNVGNANNSESSENPNDDQTEITKMYITVGGNKLEVTLEKNSTVDELVARLKQGDIVYTATRNSFEIYGSIGDPLTINDTQITAQAGDVLLYARNTICIFYGSNSYSYTRIGKINGYDASQLKNILSAGQVTIGL